MISGVDYLDLVQSCFATGGALAETTVDAIVPGMQRLSSMQIEITTWCNFACQQCLRTKSIAAGTWTNAHMPLERIATILAKLPPTDVLILQGVGEPTMHPHFRDIVAMAAGSGKFQAVSFNTNAHTHDTAFWRDLGTFPIHVNLSVDSLDQEIAQRCREGTDARLLWERLVLLHETFGTRLTVTLVASRLNLADVETTVRRIAALGAVRVQITRVLSDEPDVLLTDADGRFLHEMASRVQADHPSVELHWQGVGETLTSDARCTAPFLRPYARIDGVLAPCCVATGAEHYGNVSLVDERSWDEIRADPRITGWMRAYIASDPPVCRGCSANPRRTSELFLGGDAALLPVSNG